MAEISQVRQIISGRVLHKLQEIKDIPPVTESSPLAMFDSGVGGLTVYEQVVKLLPKESMIYFADTARVPYGSRSASEIIKINNEIIPYLISLGSKLIIMACGTSSSIAFPVIKDKYKVPMISLIEGGARMAVSATKNKKVGVIATAATINSGSYQRAIKNLNKEIDIQGVACPLLVPLIEGGFANSAETTKVLKEYLKPLIKAKIDVLVLGCTHYPHLARTIQAIMGQNVSLVDPAEEAAKKTKELLLKYKLISNGKHPPTYRFIVTGSANSFKGLGSKLLGKVIANVEEISLVKRLSRR